MVLKEHFDTVKSKIKVEIIHTDFSLNKWL